MKVAFLKRNFELIITDHAQQRMEMRNITMSSLVKIIEKGSVVKKKEENKYWVYKSFSKRTDNAVCLSVAIEKPNLIIVTALVNWRPLS